MGHKLLAAIERWLAALKKVYKVWSFATWGLNYVSGCNKEVAALLVNSDHHYTHRFDSLAYVYFVQLHSYAQLTWFKGLNLICSGGRAS